MSGEGSLTLDRGLALLQAVAEAEGEACTVSELAVRIDVSRAAVYRLLGPLTKRGLVWRDGSKVRLGTGLLRLAGKVLPQLRDAAAPVLRDLAEEVGATAHLSIADADMVEAVAVVEPSWTSFHVAYRVGTRHTIDKGAAGKAITLRQDEGDWVTTEGELQEGARGVAAPVRRVPGFRASVGVVSLGSLDVEAVGPKVVEAAARLARVLS
ncbi:helix-turn-helix domain-containing protein [Haloechinothrix sp. LS1_15]|uniref:IclR family transcriptional regulator n=1 Tax=Haloechinothrix sp. LS1_15 TaxID=2652248 RepID=UPI002946BBFC|nr:helix-turn-helix domain-containing protein [Haloechinothrix sp. LS1_15]MDV6014526.1 helix-turn-helix domain-containing protein [Haloechinothrix sp. LS1_15]